MRNFQIHRHIAKNPCQDPSGYYGSRKGTLLVSMSASQLKFSFSGLNSAIIVSVSKFTTTRAGNLFKDHLVLICHILTVFRNFDLELARICLTKMISAISLNSRSSKNFFLIFRDR